MLLGATLALTATAAASRVTMRAAAAAAAAPKSSTPLGAASAPRLILTSSGLTSASLESSFHSILARCTYEASVEPKVAMLVTAQMAPSGKPSTRSPGDLRRRRWADARKKGRELAAQIGLPVECVDCNTQYPKGDLSLLETAPVIWVTGGNTFFLWQHMRESGVADLVRRRVGEGVLYVGCSAGAIVAGRSIRPAFWKGWDDPSAAAETDWSLESSCETMGLADASFFPHYEAEAHAALVERHADDLDHEVVCLRDDGGGSLVTGDGQPELEL